MSEKIERNNGIELLRIFLTLMVCVLHTLGHGGVLNYCKIGAEFYIFNYLETLCMCAVDGYGIISGFVYNEKSWNIKKLVKIWSQSIFYSFVLTIIFQLLGITEYIGIKENIKNLLPITYNYYWYITEYSFLYLLMPSLDSISRKIRKENLMIIIIIISSISVISSIWLNSGYSCLWLAVCFIIGRLLKDSNLIINKTITRFIYVLFATLAFVALSIFNDGRLTQYNSPLIIGCAVCLVIIFSKKIVGSKINVVSSATLGIYLFQENSVIRDKYISSFINFINFDNNFHLLLEVLIFSVIIFLLGYIVEKIRVFLYKIINMNKIEEVVCSIIESCIKKFKSILNINGDKQSC